MTIAEMYEQCRQELAEVEAYRQRLLGRADTLRDLLAAGLGDVVVRETETRHTESATQP